MTKFGYVSKIEKGQTYVITECESACGHDCSTCSSECRSCLRECLAVNDIGAKTGDRVEMSVDDAKIVMLSFVVYMLPLLVFFGTWILCDYLWNDKLINALAVILLIIIWIVFLVKYNKKGVINKIVRIL